MKRFLRRCFQSWITVTHMTCNSETNIVAEATRSIRFHKKIYQMQYHSIIGFVCKDKESVKWMMKGEFINPNGSLAKKLSEEYKAFSDSGFTDFNRFNSYRLGMRLLKSLEKTPPLFPHGIDDEYAKQDFGSRDQQ